MKTKQIMVLMLLFLLPSLGCSIGSVVVEVEKKGSGRMEFSTLKIGGAENMPEIEGTSPERNSSYTLVRSSYTFEDISSVSFGGLNFDRTLDEGTAQIDVTVPLHPEAKWIQQLDVTEQRIEDLKKRLKRMSERLAERETPIDVEPEDALKLKFEINVPEEIEDYQVDAPDLDDHDWVSERNAKNRAVGDDQIVIDIPVRAILQEDLKDLSLLVRYSAGEDAVEEEDEDDSETDVQTY